MDGWHGIPRILRVLNPFFVTLIRCRVEFVATIRVPQVVKREYLCTGCGQGVLDGVSLHFSGFVLAGGCHVRLILESFLGLDSLASGYPSPACHHRQEQFKAIGATRGRKIWVVYIGAPSQ